ncbi:hypothetical protein [uncultured Nostoc sp.]
MIPPQVSHSAYGLDKPRSFIKAIAYMPNAQCLVPNPQNPKSFTH